MKDCSFSNNKDTISEYKTSILVAMIQLLSVVCHLFNGHYTSQPALIGTFS